MLYLNHKNALAISKAFYRGSQLITILKQAEAGTPLSELCCEHGMSASFYKWRSRFGGMDASMTARLKTLRKRIEN